MQDGNSAIYVISLGQVVVAQDIAQTIWDHDPDATVIVTQRRWDAVGALAGLAGRMALAFMNTPPSQLDEDVLARTVMARGGRTVLIHDEAEEQGEGPDYWVLPRPFSSDQVIDLLQRGA